MRNDALVVQDGDRETSLSEILELQAWLSRRYMPLLAQYVEQIKSGASDDALADMAGAFADACDEAQARWRRMSRSTYPPSTRTTSASNEHATSSATPSRVWTAISTSHTQR